MTKSQEVKEQIKQIVVSTMEKRKPETMKQLIALVEQTANASNAEVIDAVLQLENEGKLRFSKAERPAQATITHFLRSEKSLWYWVTITLATATTVAVFSIPTNDNPLKYVRGALGMIFVLFLPGFAFIKAFYPRSVPMETSSKDLETIERFALSVGSSLALTPIIGLLLYYSPWGIDIPPLTVGLLLLTVVLATIAVFREHQLSLGN